MSRHCELHGIYVLRVLFLHCNFVFPADIFIFRSIMDGKSINFQLAFISSSVFLCEY